MNDYDIGGLLVIMLGLIFYRFMGQLSTYIRKLYAMGDIEDEDAEERARLVGIKAESRQTKYVGINQIEALNTLIDTRVWREQRQALFRSPQQIRGSLFVRLGIPPSPMVSFSQKGGGNARTTPILGQGTGSMVPTRSPAVTAMQRNFTAAERGAAIAQAQSTVPAKKQAAEV